MWAGTSLLGLCEVCTQWRTKIVIVTLSYQRVGPQFSRELKVRPGIVIRWYRFRWRWFLVHHFMLLPESLEAVLNRRWLCSCRPLPWCSLTWEQKKLPWMSILRHVGHWSEAGFEQPVVTHTWPESVGEAIVERLHSYILQLSMVSII